MVKVEEEEEEGLEGIVSSVITLMHVVKHSKSLIHSICSLAWGHVY